jgi:hypothetical protein
MHVLFTGRFQELTLKQGRKNSAVQKKIIVFFSQP